MKKMITICMFAITMILSAQTETNDVKPDTSGWFKVQKDGFVGLVNEDGTEILAPIYDEVGELGEFHKDWILVVESGYMGFVDINGNVVVEPKYEMIGSPGDYKEDWMLVIKDGYYGFIDKSGNEVVEAIYEEIKPLNPKFQPFHAVIGNQ